MRSTSFLAGTKTDTLGVVADGFPGRRRGRSKTLRINWVSRIPLTTIENQSQEITIITPETSAQTAVPTVKELSELVGQVQAPHKFLRFDLTGSGC